MTLQLAPDEPEAGPWRAEPLTVAAATVMQPRQGNGAGHRPVALAVGGRSSSGKTTLAGRHSGIGCRACRRHRMVALPVRVGRPAD
jgi:hypothetical protein